MQARSTCGAGHISSFGHGVLHHHWFVLINYDTLVEIWTSMLFSHGGFSEPI
jgi:hypothetical protein